MAVRLRPELLDRLRATRTNPVAPTMMHGDLNLENVLVSDGAVTGFVGNRTDLVGSGQPLAMGIHLFTVALASLEPSTAGEADESVQPGPDAPTSEGIPPSPEAPQAVPFRAPRRAQPPRSSSPAPPRRAESPRRGPWTNPRSPKFRGTALIIGGSILGAAYGASQLFVTTVLMSGLGGCSASPDEACSAMSLASIVTGPWALAKTGVAIPVSLAATGLAMRGYWQAHEDRHRSVRTHRNLKPRVIAGWSLLAGGLGLWATSVAAVACDDDACLVSVHTILEHAGTAMLVAGLAMGPHGTGYLRGVSRSRATLLPVPVTGGFGLSISSRF